MNVIEFIDRYILAERVYFMASSLIIFGQSQDHNPLVYRLREGTASIFPRLATLLSRRQWIEPTLGVTRT